jgi:hypothetical protein
MTHTSNTLTSSPKCISIQTHKKNQKGALEIANKFKGAIIHFSALFIWHARTEPKCKFYAWLVMHDRVLTADNLMKRNWPCNVFALYAFAYQNRLITT